MEALHLPHADGPGGETREYFFLKKYFSVCTSKTINHLSGQSPEGHAEEHSQTILARSACSQPDASGQHQAGEKPWQAPTVCVAELPAVLASTWLQTPW